MSGFEDPQPVDLLGQASGRPEVVPVGHADQDDQARAFECADDLGADCYLSADAALDECPHGVSLPSCSDD